MLRGILRSRVTRGVTVVRILPICQRFSSICGEWICSLYWTQDVLRDHSGCLNLVYHCVRHRGRDMVMIIRRHALALLLALHPAVGYPDPNARTTVIRSDPALNPSQPAGNGSCQASCVYTVPSVSYHWWDPVSITETVTAETIVTVINRKKNTTSFSTVSNPSWDPSKHPKPTDLNSDGTRTAVITDMASFGSSSTTYTMYHHWLHAYYMVIA